MEGDTFSGLKRLPHSSMVNDFVDLGLADSGVVNAVSNAFPVRHGA